MKSKNIKIHRPSGSWFFFVTLGIVIGVLVALFEMSVKYHRFSVVALINPIIFLILGLQIVTRKTVIDGEGFVTYGFLIRKQQKVLWSDIKKVAVNDGLLSAILYFHRTSHFDPKKIGFFSRRTPYWNCWKQLKRKTRWWK